MDTADWEKSRRGTGEGERTELVKGMAIRETDGTKKLRNSDCLCCDVCEYSELYRVW